MNSYKRWQALLLWEQRPLSCKDTLLTKKLHQILTLKKEKIIYFKFNKFVDYKEAFSPVWYFVSVEAYMFSIHSKDLKMIMAKYMPSDPCFRESKKLQKFKAGNEYWDFLNQTTEKYHL
jgi:hypothetical protein